MVKSVVEFLEKAGLHLLGVAAMVAFGICFEVGTRFSKKPAL